MTLWNNTGFTENELSLFGKTAVIILLVIPVMFTTVMNIINGEVANSHAFLMCIVGFILFAISKSSLFKRGLSISFGTKRMTENMGNLYRLGYWFMAVGLMITFL